MSLLLLSGLLFTASALLTGLIRTVALRIQLLDVPVSRSAHAHPVPVAGGLSIVVCVLSALVYFYAAGTLPGNELAALFATSAIACVGFIDDFRPINVRWRMPVQFVTAIFVVYCLGDVPAIDFGLFMFPESLLLNLLAVIALVWLLNLYNFMDGIDGIAASELVTVSLISLVIVLASDDVLDLLFVSLAASGGGFLLWNWAPAKIFMGDVGSGFIGFMLGVLALLSMTHGSMTVWSWVLLLGVFIVDATLTLYTRVRQGQPWYDGHASHAYQKAARHYKSHAKVTISLIGINLFWLGPLAWLSLQYPGMGLGICIAGLLPLLFLARRLGAGVEGFSLVKVPVQR